MDSNISRRHNLQDKLTSKVRLSLASFYDGKLMAKVKGPI